MEKNKIIIGIDPDIEKSGVAILKENTIMTYNYSFSHLCYNLFTKLKELKKTTDIKVIVEASWQINNLYNKFRSLPSAVGSKIGIKIGLNHGVGRLICETARYNDLETEEVMPIKIENKKGKLSTTELRAMGSRYKIEILKQELNQEERDAAMLAMYYGLKAQ